MFVWLGISLKNELFDFSKDIIEFANENNINTPLNNLPIHVSLRISFEIDNTLFSKLEKELTEFANSLSPFNIEFEKIESVNHILWIKCKPSKELTNTHDNLCELLNEKYNIAWHELDRNFIFHSTLFMDEPQIIEKYYNKISKFKIADSVISNEILIGISENGEPNTYQIYKTIRI